jgi:hypothetical protein
MSRPRFQPRIPGSPPTEGTPTTGLVHLSSSSPACASSSCFTLPLGPLLPGCPPRRSSLLRILTQIRSITCLLVLDGNGRCPQPQRQQWSLLHRQADRQERIGCLPRTTGRRARNDSGQERDTDIHHRPSIADGAAGCRCACARNSTVTLGPRPALFSRKKSKPQRPRRPYL